MKNSLKNAEIGEVVSYDSTTGYQFTIPAIDENLELQETNEDDYKYVSNLEVGQSLYRMIITPLFHNIQRNYYGEIQGENRWDNCFYSEFRDIRFFKDEEHLNKAINLIKNAVDVERGKNFWCVHYLQLEIDKPYIDGDVKKQLSETDNEFFWQMFYDAPCDENETETILTLFQN